MINSLPQDRRSFYILIFNVILFFGTNYFFEKISLKKITKDIIIYNLQLSVLYLFFIILIFTIYKIVKSKLIIIFFHPILILLLTFSVYVLKNKPKFYINVIYAHMLNILIFEFLNYLKTNIIMR